MHSSAELGFDITSNEILEVNFLLIVIILDLVIVLSGLVVVIQQETAVLIVHTSLHVEVLTSLSVIGL